MVLKTTTFFLLTYLVTIGCIFLLLKQSKIKNFFLKLFFLYSLAILIYIFKCVGSTLFFFYSGDIKPFLIFICVLISSFCLIPFFYFVCLNSSVSHYEYKNITRAISVVIVIILIYNCLDLYGPFISEEGKAYARKLYELFME